MRCDVIAVGTELLLGQIVNTNASEIGQMLAENGIDTYKQVTVGDNRERIVAEISRALEAADALIVTGGLGPTHDDVTRDAVAEVMGVELKRDDAVVERIKQIFRDRNREMSDTNLRQAEVPQGATVIAQRIGTAPGLICPVDNKVVYLIPGVPDEMREMMSRAVVPDLLERSGNRSPIVSRMIRTFGISESKLAELLGDHITDLDNSDDATIAFLANVTRGVTIRVTAKDPLAIDKEEKRIRDVADEWIYGVDGDSLESVVAELVVARNVSLGVAESLTGGSLAARLVNVPGASDWFRGGIVSYASDVKFDLLEVPEGPVVSEKAAIAMAEGACRVLKSDIGLSVTGVAGPAEQEGQPVGTVFVGVSIDGKSSATEMHLAGTRERIRESAVSSALNALRKHLLKI
jgi:nicotinamide-nucleotide amidase